MTMPESPYIVGETYTIGKYTYRCVGTESQQLGEPGYLLRSEWGALTAPLGFLADGEEAYITELNNETDALKRRALGEEEVKGEQ